MHDAPHHESQYQQNPQTVEVKRPDQIGRLVKAGKLHAKQKWPRDRDARVAEGERVRVSSRRGAVEVAVRIDEGLREGLVFMTLHFPDEVDTNRLTIDATDPKSGTAEFKAAAVRIDKLPPPLVQVAE